MSAYTSSLRVLIDPEIAEYASVALANVTACARCKENA